MQSWDHLEQEKEEGVGEKMGDKRTEGKCLSHHLC